MAAPFPIDDIVRTLLASYQRVAMPGRQARVEQLAEQLCHNLGRAGLPITPLTARALFVGLAIGTTVAELDPRHPNASLATDLIAATAQLTRPRVDAGDLDRQWGWSW